MLMNRLRRGLIASVTVLLGGLLPIGMVTGAAFAAGDASFSISPTGGSYTTGSTITVSISETSVSGDDVNAVQADLSYNTSLLTYDSMSLTGPFTLCGQQTSGGGSVDIGCAATSAQSGAQAVAKVVFTVESAGTATVAMTSGSDIDNTSGSSVWNGTLPSASYTLTAPSSGGGSTGSSGSSSSGSSASPTGTKSTSSSTPKSTASPTPKTSTTPTTVSPTTTSTKTPAATTPTIETPTPVTKPTSVTTGSVTITVTSSNGTPVANAKIVLDSRYTEYTNAKGQAGFSAIVSGTHTIAVTASGKKTVQQQIQLSGGQAKLVAVKLTGAASVIPWIVVIAMLALSGAGYWYFKVFRRNNYTGPIGPLPPVTVGSGTAPPTSVGKSTITESASTVIKPDSSDSG